MIDPKVRWTVDVTQFKSKSRNSPYHGWEPTGRALATIVAGEIKKNEIRRRDGADRDPTR